MSAYGSITVAQGLEHQNGEPLGQFSLQLFPTTLCWDGRNELLRQ